MTGTTNATLPEVFYEAQEDEGEEDDTFVVKNETQPEDKEDDDVPVRSLTDFTIYDVDACCRLVAFSAEFGTDNAKTYGASGLVSAWAESDANDLSISDDGASEGGDDSAPQRISLSRILEVSVHSVERELKTKLVLDP